MGLEFFFFEGGSTLQLIVVVEVGLIVGQEQSLAEFSERIHLGQKVAVQDLFVFVGELPQIELCAQLRVLAGLVLREAVLHQELVGRLLIFTVEVFAQFFKLLFAFLFEGGPLLFLPNSLCLVLRIQEVGSRPPLAREPRIRFLF